MAYNHHPIPTGIVIYGDVTAGRKLIPLGRKFLSALENEMSLIDMPCGKRSRKVNATDSITVAIAGGMSSIVINVGSSAKRRPVKPLECFCNCNFTAGTIMKVQEGEFIWKYAQLYTVEACNLKDKYVMFENVLATDFTQYIEGEKVILKAYNLQAHNCPSGVAFGCAPILSEYERQDDQWRTILRIVPWRGDLIPRWKDG